MKRFFSLVFAVLTFTVSVFFIDEASAVEVVNNDGQKTPFVASEEAVFLLSASGNICGLNNHSENQLAVIELQEKSSVISGVRGDGKVVRKRATHQVTLDDECKISNGGSSIICSWQSFDVELCKKLGLEGAADVVDNTIVAYPTGIVSVNGDAEPVYNAYHRFLTKNSGKELGHLSVWINGTRFHISVYYADWDGDGNCELCFRAGSAQ